MSVTTWFVRLLFCNTVKYCVTATAAINYCVADNQVNKKIENVLSAEFRMNKA